MWGTDSGMTVAVVDDDPGCRELHRHWLDETHEVRSAGSGIAALDVIDDEVDIVLLDREMPGLTGCEVVDHLRDRAFDGYIVFVSGRKPGPGLVDIDIDEYLTKPVSERELVAVLDRLQRRGRYHRQLRELVSLATKKAHLELEYEQSELHGSPEYLSLDTELREMRTEMIRAVEERNADWRAAFEACGSTVSAPSTEV